MDQRTYGQWKGVLLDTLKKLDRNNQCVYPDCKKKPIASHIIAESALKRIAHDGKILTWNWYEEDIVHSDPHDQDWERIYVEPKEVFIGKDVTYPIFCATHDNDTFRSLENPGFDGEMEQVAQLAYRALCYKTWNPHVRARLKFLLSFTEPQLFVEQEPFLAANALLQARERLEIMLHMGDYAQLERRIITLDIAPCIACTDAFIPINEDEETTLRNGLPSLTAEDILTFSFFPAHDPYESTCIITWFRESQRAHHYLESLELHKLSAEEQAQMLVATGFRHNIFISPIWWQSQSPETRQKSVQFQLAHAYELTHFSSARMR